MAKKKFVVPVSWGMYSTVLVEADSPEEAIELALSVEDDIPLGDGEYIDGSYRIETDPGLVMEQSKALHFGRFTVLEDGSII